jgi:hypothetical protein
LLHRNYSVEQCAEVDKALTKLKKSGVSSLPDISEEIQRLITILEQDNVPGMAAIKTESLSNSPTKEVQNRTSNQLLDSARNKLRASVLLNQSQSAVTSSSSITSKAPAVAKLSQRSLSSSTAKQTSPHPKVISKSTESKPTKPEPKTKRKSDDATNDKRHSDDTMKGFNVPKPSLSTIKNDNIQQSKVTQKSRIPKGTLSKIKKPEVVIPATVTSHSSRNSEVANNKGGGFINIEQAVLSGAKSNRTFARKSVPIAERCHSSDSDTAADAAIVKTVKRDQFISVVQDTDEDKSYSKRIMNVPLLKESELDTECDRQINLYYLIFFFISKNFISLLIFFCI